MMMCSIVSIPRGFGVLFCEDGSAVFKGEGLPGLEGDGGDEQARATVITVTARHANRQATGLADTDVAAERARGLSLAYDSIRIKPFTPEPHGGKPAEATVALAAQGVNLAINVVHSRTMITVRLKGARSARFPEASSPRAWRVTKRKQKDRAIPA